MFDQCNVDKLRCKSPRKDNQDIASVSFLLRISKPPRSDNRSSLNAPLDSETTDRVIMMTCTVSLTVHMCLDQFSPVNHSLSKLFCVGKTVFSVILGFTKSLSLGGGDNSRFFTWMVVAVVFKAPIKTCCHSGGITHSTDAFLSDLNFITNKYGICV